MLSGRAGLDRLTGGGGNDIFDYDAVTDSKPGSANRDVILDFVGVGAAVGDRIELSAIDANTSKTGNQAFVFKGIGAIGSVQDLSHICSGDGSGGFGLLRVERGHVHVLAGGPVGRQRLHPVDRCGTAGRGATPLPRGERYVTL